jgi:diadenosine tetraphosphate (Ap4A) HIT family hydrolase
MTNESDYYEDSPLAAIIRGELEGTIIARDDEQKFAIISSMEPEAAVHWLAVPFESGFSTSDMKTAQSDRFMALLDFALAQTHARVADYPVLENGFTIKFHCGAYETVPHAKFHILSVE